MPINTDYSDHSKFLVMIEDAVSSEKNQRSKVKEQNLFVYDHEGQWDKDVAEKMGTRYKGTFDLCFPKVKSFHGEVIGASFTLRASPKDGVASKKNAEVYDGMFRNIRSISNADTLFNKQAVSCFVGGFDCVEVVQEHNNDKTSFDQDLYIKGVTNASDSVWWDPASVEQDKSDANWSVKKKTIPTVEYEAKYDEEERSNVSVGESVENGSTLTKPTNNTITIAQVYYRKEIKTEIVQMSNGDVYPDDDDFKKVQDDLEKAGTTIKGRKTVKILQVFSRKLDGGGWLGEEKRTVFTIQPLIPIFGNFVILDNVYIYFGEILKLMDPQRAFNYGTSRSVEDEALGMTEKVVISTEQIKGNEEELAKLNVANRPVLPYTHVEGHATPHKIGANQANAALFNINTTMKGMITEISNSFNSQQGNALGAQSGIAGLNQITQSNLTNAPYMESSQIQICGVGRVLLGAIPLTYDGERQVRLLSENGDSKMVTLNKKIFDAETGENIELHSLGGNYDVNCEMGPAFKSAQKESEQLFNQLAQTSPEVGALTADLRITASNAPGAKLAGERVRGELFAAGRIPEEQWTEEEKQKVAQQQADAANTPPVETAEMVFARAEEKKADTDFQKASHDASIQNSNMDLEFQKVQLENKKIDLETDKFIQSQTDKNNKVAADIDQGQQKIDLTAQQQEFNQAMAEQKAFMEELKLIAEQDKADREEFHKNVADWKVMFEASGADAIVTPTVPEVFEHQAQTILEDQHNNEV